MDKIWLKSYPLQRCRRRSIPTSTARWCSCSKSRSQKFADRNAYVCMDKFLTYAELDTYSRRARAPGCKAAA